MRWATYTDARGGARAGLVVGSQIHALSADQSVRNLLGDDGERMAAAAESAVDDPHEVVDLDVGAVVGPNDPVHISPGSRWFDFELEIAAIVGRGGHDLHPDRAEEHIAGFTILCDWSARDLQYREAELGLGPAKGKDGATTLGPHLVTLDELAPHRDQRGWSLRMQAWVNDEHAQTDRDHFRGFLRPGDVVRLEVEGLGSTSQEVLPARALHPLSSGH